MEKRDLPEDINPYQSPSAPTEEPRPVRRSRSKYEFRDHPRLTRTLQGLLIAGIAVLGVSFYSGWMEYQLLDHVANGGEITEAEADANDSRQMQVGILQLGVAILTGITFLMWIYRSCANAHALSEHSMEFTAGWAVGWFFIPIANLFRPYQAMKETWEESHMAAGREASGAILGGWWALWIISNIASQAAYRTSLRADEVSEMLTSTSIYLLSDGIDVVLNLVAFVMVGSLYKTQMAGREKQRQDMRQRQQQHQRPQGDRLGQQEQLEQPV